MPFTISHTAAVLPFPRKYMPLSALAIGSMAPDLPYFIMLSDISKVGHTLSGLFLFCVPVGLAVLWLFHRCLKLPMLALAPESLRRRIPSDQQFHFFPLTRLLLLALCVLLGAVTHVLWDGFTHLRGMFAVLLPALQEMSPFWPHLPIYALLQHFSSVLGLAVLGAASSPGCERHLPRHNRPCGPSATAQSGCS